MLLSPDRRRSLADLQVIAAFAAGTVLGATATGLVLWVLAGLAAPLPGGTRGLLLVAGGSVAWAGREGPWRDMLRLPEARRQIPAQVFGGSLVRGAWRFGLELGTGVRTYAPASAPYVLAVTFLLIRPALWMALLAAVGFGLARALPLAARLAGAGRSDEAAARLGRPSRLVQTSMTLLVLAGALTLL